MNHCRGGLGLWFSAHMRFRALLAVVCAMASALGCRGGGADGTSGGAPGSGGHAAGEAGVGGAGVGGQGGEGPSGGFGGQGGTGGARPVPGPGECVEVTRLTKSPELSGEVRRVQDGFVIFTEPLATDETREWLIGNDRDEWQSVPISLSPNTSYELMPTPIAVGTAAEPRAIRMSIGAGSVGFANHFFSQILDESGELLGEPTSVLEIFDRLSSTNVSAGSLDGERAAVGNAHSGVWDPRIVLLDRDGKPVSDEIHLLETGDSPLYRCFALTGTAHGVVATIIDEDTGELRLLELDAQGQVVQEATLEGIDDILCPRVSVDPSGVFVSFGLDAQSFSRGSARDVYRASGGALDLVATLPEPPEDVSYGWALGGDVPLVSARSQTGVRFAEWRGTELLPLEGDFTGRLIPSADGRLFVADASREDPVIVEVSCAPGAP